MAVKTLEIDDMDAFFAEHWQRIAEELAGGLFQGATVMEDFLAMARRAAHNAYVDGCFHGFMAGVRAATAATLVYLWALRP